MPDFRDEQSATADTLTMHTRPLPGGGFLLTLTGALDHHTSPRLTNAVEELLQTDARTLWLELSGLTFIDSTGLTCLLHISRAVTEAGGHLTLAAPSTPVQRMLDITGIGQVLTVRTDTYAAGTAHGGRDEADGTPGEAG
ncbi:STAS domain-containing protein [Streptomyces anandii]|uniref:STAS domain-containing protein n=1 Tax=Streptomyces anandii TaxID=285454 RepID=UPI00379823E7